MCIKKKYTSTKTEKERKERGGGREVRIAFVKCD
jgi:hypothetical protein